MNGIALIGLFKNGYEAFDGQSIKTRIVTQEIQRSIGADKVLCIDTYEWKKHPHKLLFKCIRAVWRYENVVFMTDEGGIKVFPWLLTIANFARKSRIHYVVIGGWLGRTLNRKRMRRFWLKKLDGVYVETRIMRTVLECNGLKNVVLLPNCKYLPILREDELLVRNKEPYRLCTFSRVAQEKGIQDAVEAVGRTNKYFGRKVFTLDIYGQVDKNEREWFEKLRSVFPEGVRYCGSVPYNQSTEILKEYFALLFPTKFRKEGIPGTIIDAYAAGLPVIASMWDGCEDVVDEQTCIGYPFGSFEGLVSCLEEVAVNPDLINGKRIACVQRAKMYMPEQVMKTLLNHMGYRV